MGGDRRVALVTGGGRGIGRAVALRLASAGMAVGISYNRDEASAKSTVDDVRNLGGESVFCQATLEEGSDCERLIETVRRELGPISVLVNNAGQATPALGVLDVDPGDALRAFELHALGALRLSQGVIPDMRGSLRGDIVMISSSAPQVHPRNTAVYSMAKAALESLAYVLAREEARNNIRVNIVAPGLVSTRMGTAVIRGLQGADAQVEDVDRFAPFGRVCRPEDVANLIGFLVSEEGGYVSGSRLSIDGGSPGWAGQSKGSQP